jgi:hypothetical protein
MAGLSSAFSLIGTLVSAAGTIAAGQASRRAAEYRAAQVDIRSREERAAGQLEARELARERRLALSRNQAVAAASGFSADDPGALDLAGDVASRGAFQEALARYGGESRGAGLRAEAQGLRLSGEAAERSAYFSAAGTILGGVSTMFERFGRRTMIRAAAPHRPGGGPGYG